MSRASAPVGCHGATKKNLPFFRSLFNPRKTIYDNLNSRVRGVSRVQT
jgi:hypothetical protein